jgi:hypothetical protein
MRGDCLLTRGSHGEKGDHLDNVHAAIKLQFFMSVETTLHNGEGTKVNPRRSLISGSSVQCDMFMCITNILQGLQMNVAIQALRDLIQAIKGSGTC